MVHDHSECFQERLNSLKSTEMANTCVTVSQNPSPIEKNTLFYGDNLKVLRDYIQSESIDLVYLDPPFNSKENYNVLFKEKGGRQSSAQIQAFSDFWHWDDASEKAYLEIQERAPEAAEAVKAFVTFLGRNDMTAYIVMMAIRLVELHRVLKRTGSLYLHCDPTASHYLKVILDTVFGATYFKNEITWK
jgi:site-specific DNA-methyltransferase (adenine-specific)